MLTSLRCPAHRSTRQLSERSSGRRAPIIIIIIISTNTELFTIIRMQHRPFQYMCLLCSVFAQNMSHIAWTMLAQNKYCSTSRSGALLTQFEIWDKRNCRAQEPVNRPQLNRCLNSILSFTGSGKVILKIIK